MDLKIDRREADLLVALLRPRAHLLGKLLEVQIQSLEPGNDSWCSTQDDLRTANSALIKVRNAQLEHDDNSSTLQGAA